MTVTVQSGFWGTNYSLLSSKHPMRQVARNVMLRRGLKDVNELADTTIGATAGSTASASISRVKAKNETTLGDIGGKVEIESQEIINRATTAADVTSLKATFAPTTDYTYPANKAGADILDAQG